MRGNLDRLPSSTCSGQAGQPTLDGLVNSSCPCQGSPLQSTLFDIFISDPQEISKAGLDVAAQSLAQLRTWTSSQGVGPNDLQGSLPIQIIFGPETLKFSLCLLSYLSYT